MLSRLAPVAVIVSAVLLYLLTAQRQLYNDGIFFLTMLENSRTGGSLLYSHPLYLPVVAAVWHGLEVLDSSATAELAMKVTSACAGGLTLGFAYASFRRVLPGGPALGALVLMTGPIWAVVSRHRDRTAHRAQRVRDAPVLRRHLST